MAGSAAARGASQVAAEQGMGQVGKLGPTGCKCKPRGASASQCQEQTCRAAWWHMQTSDAGAQSGHSATVGRLKPNWLLWS